MAAPEQPLADDALLAAVTAAMVSLHRRYYQREPFTAKAQWMGEDLLACVLGGVSLSGGVGTMSGVVVGVLIMGIVQNAMNLLHIPPFYQYVASGAILLAAVLLDRIRQREAS